MRPAIRNPCPPEFCVRCLGNVVQIWNHRGTIWAFMADGTIGIIKFLAEFTFALCDMTTSAITAENSLPVCLGGSDVLCTVNAGHGIGKSRINGDFDGERLGIFVSADGYGFGKRAALGCNVDLDSNLTVCAGCDNPR